MTKRILKKNFPLIIILVVSLLIRLIGTKPGYSPYHPDESMSYSSAVKMIVDGNLDPGRYDYPAGIPLIHYFLFRFFFLPLSLLRVFFSHPRAFLTAVRFGRQFLAEFVEPIFGHRQINALFWSRYITAVLGTGAVWLTYFLAKKLFGKEAGLLAAFFLAFNYRHVLSSHFALSDIPNGFFALLAVYTAVLLLEKNSLKRYLLAGLSCGLFLSMKYQIFPVFAFFLAHLAWVFRNKSLKLLFHQNFLLAGCLIPVVFIIFNPLLLLKLKEALPVVRYVGLRYGMGANHFNFYPFFYLYHWGIDRWPSLAIMGGLVLGLFLKPLGTLLLLSFIFPFFFVFTYYSGGGTYVRNFNTVIPFLLILAGFFFSELFRLLKSITQWPVHLLIPLFLMLVFWINLRPIKNSATLVYFYTQPWKLTQLTTWLRKNLPFDLQVRSHSVVNFPEGRRVNRLDWDLRGGTSVAELRELGDQFAVMNLDFYHVLLFDWFDLPKEEMVRYPGIPYDFLTNIFSGLALEEWLGYTVAEFFKPWQSYDLNYLVFKILPSLDKFGEPVASFGFNQNDEGWQVKGQFGRETAGFVWNETEGQGEKGSLEISERAKGSPTACFSSPPIPIKPGRYYTFLGQIKNSVNLDEGSREPFLRMDFYQDRTGAQLGKERLKVALSSRVFGPSQWVEKRAEARAPEAAHYVVLAFQTSDLSSGFSSFLDDVILFESENSPRENFPQIPYIQTTISERELYPNSVL